jgi:hypothetical protein
MGDRVDFQENVHRGLLLRKRASLDVFTFAPRGHAHAVATLFLIACQAQRPGSIQHRKHLIVDRESADDGGVEKLACSPSKYRVSAPNRHSGAAGVPLPQRTRLNATKHDDIMRMRGS